MHHVLLEVSIENSVRLPRHDLIVIDFTFRFTYKRAP